MTKQQEINIANYNIREAKKLFLRAICEWERESALLTVHYWTKRKRNLLSKDQNSENLG